MQIPVIIYLSIILLMARQALDRHLQLKSKASMMALAGALFFLASDSLLALNKFHDGITLPPFFVMWTYLAAQWLIANSIAAKEDS